MKYIKHIVILVLTALLLFLFLRRMDFAAVGQVLRHINPWIALLFVGATIPQFFIRAQRWRVLLAQRTGRVTLKSAYHYTVIGFMLSFLFFRIGEVVRPLLLAEKEKLNKSSALATIVNERLLDLLTMVLIFVCSVTFLPLPASALLSTLRRYSIIILPALLAIFVIIMLCNRPAMLRRIEALVERLCRVLPERFRAKVAQSLIHFLEGLDLGLTPARMALLLGWSLFLWLYVIAGYWLLMRAFPAAALQGAHFAQIVPFFTMVFFSAAIPTPGMVGSFDLASKTGLTTFIGVAEQTAIAYTVLVHFLIIAMPVLLGLISMSLEGLGWGAWKRTQPEAQS